jgi:hypothetical protein
MQPTASLITDYKNFRTKFYDGKIVYRGKNYALSPVKAAA